ncbi:MAG: 2,3-bisphosphoglycerate-dependent phosphoglycerate mutase [Methylococcales bacterium]|nr:2,3-bisphosphoglycerate-dependent phosphoglycerate mutase [Methylococcales bacterium]
MAKLVLVRHGQSVWNLQNRFTGWIDVPLSKKGIKEALNAGKLLKDFKFDVAFTSALIRAQDTLYEILNVNNNSKYFLWVHEDKSDWYKKFKETKDDKDILKVYTSEKLNERYYGDLQGLNKEDTIKKFGQVKVHLWRRSFDVPPPNGESLEMTAKRTIPYFKTKILKELNAGKDVLVVAHGNSLRSIIMFIEDMPDEDIIEFEIATGSSHIYTFESNMNIQDKQIL